ncbi:response regulator transcription factor [Cohnella thailandensis]|uniref:Response regulator transcription factor n=1 Tax=Cohnella thailandensis TaxID=557557 RepID=A0A841SYA1_9BACL|nr:response regulator transcription factor [Cohnella thailandensis]MBB6636884.1 response regulator transcription factor [Cohnella thailandensis]MBP1973236.1 DNA-binding response OmpR family regulator [Cohnella thailandensis]
MEKPVHVLVVEDDDDINRLLCGVLTRSGYIPQPAYSGTEALLYLDRQVWSLVLLDLMLPGLRGEELLAAIGAKGDTPVIVITAENERETKIAALKTGADDYVTKPFDLEEVSARVDSLLRRFRRLPAAVPPKLLRHKDLVVDPEAKSATVGGRELSLTAREYDILELFLSSPKKLFSKANVFESVWGEAFLGGEENAINVHMSNLRNKLAKANPDEDYIETIWGMGYRLKT